MVQKSIGYIAKRIRQIAILSVSMAIFSGLCLVSLTEAGNKNTINSKREEALNISPSSAMQLLMMDIKSPLDQCELPKKIPLETGCKSFFSVDDSVLQNLIINYRRCLDGHKYYYNFSTIKNIVLRRPLIIYGRSDEPLTISGLKLKPAKSFSENQPAIIIYGKGVRLKNIELEGFEYGILYASKNNEPHEIIGGHVFSKNESSNAITSCHNSPKITDLIVSGNNERVSSAKEN